jgi:hypothetical protein
MPDNGAQGQKIVKDTHNDDALVGPADIAQVMETILENQRTHCLSPIPPK